MRAKSTFISVMIICLCIAVTLAFVSCETLGISKKGPKASVSVVGSGKPGNPMEINGVGFKPGEAIELVLQMEDLPVIVGEKAKGITVKEDGTFKVKTAYPHKLYAIPGSWDLVASGSKGTSAKCKVEIKKP
jgi:hypothetical protein